MISLRAAVCFGHKRQGRWQYGAVRAVTPIWRASITAAPFGQPFLSVCACRQLACQAIQPTAAHAAQVGEQLRLARRESKSPLTRCDIERSLGLTVGW